MNAETLKRAKEIEKEIARLSYVNVVIKGTDNINAQIIALDYTRKEVINERTVNHDRLSIDIEDFFTKQDLSEKVNHRITELQNELDSL